VLLLATNVYSVQYDDIHLEVYRLDYSLLTCLL